MWLCRSYASCSGSGILRNATGPRPKKKEVLVFFKNKTKLCAKKIPPGKVRRGGGLMFWWPSCLWWTRPLRCPSPNRVRPCRPRCPPWPTSRSRRGWAPGGRAGGPGPAAGFASCCNIHLDDPNRLHRVTRTAPRTVFNDFKQFQK